MTQRILWAVITGTLIAGLPIEVYAQSQVDTIGPFTQPYQRRCGVVVTSPGGTDDVFWGVSTNPATACNSALKMMKNYGYGFGGFYEIPSELYGAKLPMGRPRTQQRIDGICFPQPGEACY